MCRSTNIKIDLLVCQWPHWWHPAFAFAYIPVLCMTGVASKPVWRIGVRVTGGVSHDWLCWRCWCFIANPAHHPALVPIEYAATYTAQVLIVAVFALVIFGPTTLLKR